MNANELANELDDIDAYEKHQTLLGKCAEMLRQQQVEIEALKTKTLTDEEITATFNYFYSTKDEAKSPVNDSKYFEESMILYARLILEAALRKAQEKC
jgi:hypothetical protein